MPRHSGNTPHGSRRHHRAAHRASKGKRCQAESSQADPIGAAWPTTTDELAQVSDNDAEELLPVTAFEKVTKTYDLTRSAHTDRRTYQPPQPGQRSAPTTAARANSTSGNLPKINPWPLRAYLGRTPCTGARPQEC